MKTLRSFPALFFRFTLRFYGKHPARSLLVLLGVSLGAAVFTSVRLSVDASMNALDSSLKAISGPADWVVSSPGRRLPDSVISTLARDDRVLELAPMLSVYLRHPETDQTLRLVGLDPFLERSFRGLEDLGADFSDWRRLMAQPFSLLLGRAAAESLGKTAGERLILSSSRGRFRCEVIGVLDNKGLSAIDGGLSALADLATVQEISGRMHKLDRINLVLAPGVSGSALAASLPKGCEIQPASSLLQSGSQMAGAYEFNLSMLSFVSLFVGMFLVYSMVAFNAASRRFEVAVLRSLGAGRPFIFWLFLVEGGILGFLGWILAIPLSLLLTRWLIEDVSATVSTLFVRVAANQASIGPAELGFSLGVTLLVALLAAVQPAWEAMRVPPREAMQRVRPLKRDRGKLLRPALIGCCLVVLAWPVSYLPNPGGRPVFPYLATFGLFIGFALMAPLLLRLLCRGLAPLLGRLGLMPALLAGRSLQQAGPRIAVSVGALITALALFVALSIMLTSFRTTFSEWISQTISGDLFIRPLNADENRYRDPLPEPARRWIAGQAEDALILPYQRYHLQYRGRQIQVETLDLERFQEVGRFLFLKGGIHQETEPGETSPGALISEKLVQTCGLTIGDRFTFQVKGRTISFRVSGVIRSYRTRGGVVYVPRSQFEKQTGITAWSGVRLFFPGENPVDRARAFHNRLLKETDLASSLEITLGTELRAVVHSIFEETFAVTTVLLGIAMVVAGLGIAATLSVIILEEIRELATLTAIGASSGQLRALVFWEAGYLAGVGGLAGLACGFLLSLILIYVVNRVSFGWTFVFSLDWFELALVIPLVLLAAGLAALPVLRLTRRMSPALALRQE
ncbi:MAG: ABC transporter permease [Desulfohalobiaceae bacterium]|nr:ABC transporter permease [Desulfohalobiaceae bacterium]